MATAKAPPNQYHQISPSETKENRLDIAGPSVRFSGNLRSTASSSLSKNQFLRTIREILPGDDNSVKTIDEAYSLRSKLLHEGVTDPYLDRKTHELEQALRRLYAARIGKRLRIGG